MAGRRSVVRVIAPVVGLLAECLLAAEANAFRPFDGADAAVADPGQLEVELEPVGYERDGGARQLFAPMTVLSYGLVPGWEISLQETTSHGVAGGASRFSLIDNALFFKGMLREGSLQGKPGPSVATEFGVLLPDLNGQAGVGGSVAGIVSQRWPWFTAHLNALAELTPEHNPDLQLDLILEGPHDWTVRPVAEFIGERDFGGVTVRSALFGAIWQIRDDLALDAGARSARVNGVPVFEVRAGVTFGFRLGR